MNKKVWYSRKSEKNKKEQYSPKKTSWLKKGNMAESIKLVI